MHLAHFVQAFLKRKWCTLTKLCALTNSFTLSKFKRSVCKNLAGVLFLKTLPLLQHIVRPLFPLLGQQQLGNVVLLRPLLLCKSLDFQKGCHIVRAATVKNGWTLLNKYVQPDGAEVQPPADIQPKVRPLKSKGLIQHLGFIDVIGVRLRVILWRGIMHFILAFGNYG